MFYDLEQCVNVTMALKDKGQSWWVFCVVLPQEAVVGITEINPSWIRLDPVLDCEL